MTLPTVLIADDAPQVRLALRIRFEALVHEVVECRARLGVNINRRSKRVDAMILDHEMPLDEGRTIGTKSAISRICR